MTDSPARRPAPADPDPFRRLVAIMDRLLAPDGCPWDREQSHETLRPYVVEEAYEVVEAIDDGDWDELKSELGDLGLQIVFHAALARREGRFAIDDVYAAICEKLVRRHPHVFGDTQANDSGTVLRNWEAIKRAERAERASDAGAQEPSVLDGVPRALPALQRAQRLQVKAARVGFDWKQTGPVWEKIREEVDELEQASQQSPEKLHEEFGDLMFALVNIARFLHVDPEQALHDANAKFRRRFMQVEQRARAAGRQLEDMTLEEMDVLWGAIKAEERER